MNPPAVVVVVDWARSSVACKPNARFRNASGVSAESPSTLRGLPTYPTMLARVVSLSELGMDAG
jgi:hypothetical protein